MDLATLLARYPGIELADPADPDHNRDLLAFFDSQTMHGAGLHLRYERAPNFFRFLEYQSDTAYVFYVRKPAGTIGGMGTISIRPGYIHGILTSVGYLGDLRINRDRRLARRWRQFYAALLAAAPEMPELQYCRHFLTAILDTNHAARRALVEAPRAPFRYQELAPYRMVNILGRFPWPRPGRTGPWRVFTPAPEDMPRVFAFFDMQNGRKAFGFAPGEWQRRLEHWQGFGPDNFVVCAVGDRLCGVFATWTPYPAKRIVVTRLPRLAHWLCRGLRRCGLDAPCSGQPLQVLYLTALHIDETLPDARRATIFGAMLDFLWQRGDTRSAQVLAFCDFVQRPLAAALTGYLTHTTPLCLYQVRHTDAAIDTAISTSGMFPPGFEMALV